MKFILFIFCLLALNNSFASTNEKISNTLLVDSLSLKYLIKYSTVQTNKKKAIILLHGLGSNEEDLFSLAQNLPKDYIIICPRGLYTFSKGSYAWYNVDFSSGKPLYDAKQELQSRTMLLQFIEQVKSKYQIEELYVGGFSQGAIMSFTLGLEHPSTFKGIICMSGRILQEIQPNIKENKELSQLKIFLAHGTQDGTLSINYAREAKNFLEKIHTQLSYFEFNMGHQICSEELVKLVEWLD